VSNPDVFKGSDNTFVIFGEAKVEQDNVNQALSDTVNQFKPTDEDDDIPELVPQTTGTVEEVTPSNETQMDQLVQLVIDQTNCSRPVALAALQENKGDVVAAIMKVTQASGST